VFHSFQICRGAGGGLATLERGLTAGSGTLEGNEMTGFFGGWQADQISVDLKAAQGLVASCSELLTELWAVEREAASLQFLDAMGTLKSGQDLAAKFSKKAVGGEDSLEKSLNSHIQVVTEMRDFFQQCVDRYGEVDDSNASALTSAETPR
jgi:hypothetical protein